MAEAAGAGVVDEVEEADGVVVVVVVVVVVQHLGHQDRGKHLISKTGN